MPDPEQKFLPSAADLKARWKIARPRVTATIAALIVAVVLLAILSHWEQPIVNTLKVLTWAHTGPMLLLAIVLLFRERLAELLSRLVQVNKTEKGLEFVFEKAPTPAATSAIVGVESADQITVEDVVNEFPKIPKLPVDDIKLNAAEAHSWLLRNGIRDKATLQAFIGAKKIFEDLATIYVDELNRSADSPYDSIAIATWGSALFVLGPTQHNLEAMRNLIRQSPEYKEKTAKRYVVYH